MDDTLFTGLKSDDKLTDTIPHQFETKLKEYPLILFARSNMTCTSGGFFFEKPTTFQVYTLKPDTEFDTFRTTSHKITWVSHTSPVIIARVNIIE